MVRVGCKVGGQGRGGGAGAAAAAAWARGEAQRPACSGPAGCAQPAGTRTSSCPAARRAHLRRLEPRKVLPRIRHGRRLACTHQPAIPSAPAAAPAAGRQQDSSSSLHRFPHTPCQPPQHPPPPACLPTLLLEQGQEGEAVYGELKGARLAAGAAQRRLVLAHPLQRWGQVVALDLLWVGRKGRPQEGRDRRAGGCGCVHGVVAVAGWVCGRARRAGRGRGPAALSGAAPHCHQHGAPHIAAQRSTAQRTSCNTVCMEA